MHILRRVAWIGCSCGLLIACNSDATKPTGESRGAAKAACTTSVAPSDDDQTTLEGALIDAQSGDTICLKSGRYHPSGQLSLDVDHVTVRGEADTVLDFTDQKTGANGLEVTSDGVTLESLRLENTHGDGVRATSVRDLVVRGVRVAWTAGASPTNGGYGIYPVSSMRVLIEDCYASGASDTGIYVGQSSQIVIRNSEVTQNVAGIEVENSTDAEVYGNHAHDNTAGILLFNLPGLPVRDGKRANVHDNVIEHNDGVNFAKSGNIVASIPPGTGMFILASDDNEVHSNMIRDNRSIGVAVVSWFVALREDDARMDPLYDWFPERNYVHSNIFEHNGAEPQGTAALIAGVVGETTLAEMVWDGFVDSAKLTAADEGSPVPPDTLRNCFKDNGTASFMALDLEHNGAAKSTDASAFACERPALAPASLQP